MWSKSGPEKGRLVALGLRRLTSPLSNYPAVSSGNPRFPTSATRPVVHNRMTRCCQCRCFYPRWCTVSACTSLSPAPGAAHRREGDWLRWAVVGGSGPCRAARRADRRVAPSELWSWPKGPRELMAGREFSLQKKNIKVILCTYNPITIKTQSWKLPVPTRKLRIIAQNSILCIKQGMNGFMCEAAIDKTRRRRSEGAERLQRSRRCRYD